MIKHHPSFELIQSFVNGDLPASLSAGIAIHADMCPKCQQIISQLTEQVAENSFEETFLDRFIVDDMSDFDDNNMSNNDLKFTDMIDNITSSEEIAVAKTKVEKTINFREKTYQLPSALHSMKLGKTAQIGKLSRARVQLDEGEIHTTLLHISPGGGVPEHTHKGFELTVLLDGSFHDEQGEYVKGDFIMLDSSHQHHPISIQGCLCYTVANDALHFTQGINKLLNPIGAFIY
ncbi:ChrR family anti-sigma-E factor [Thalassotalea profundi]|uniref:Zinc-binding anti-sigmaE4 factor ChrR n=1 Tax=Thalassotalea profundi TaxID=2036687 RepID=A0ABQ3IED4_9GAMM|nr:ChrR family anti-sigma-E factor [Thalassotalea profundi]GHE81399.1 zinc-binding anti-sigmaE4 factor ChrR [Thalassotalea profundi]